MAATTYTRDDRCAACTESSKQVAGFWNSRDEKLNLDITGQYYDCANLECPVKKLRMFNRESSVEVIEANRAKNAENGIDFDKLETFRRRNNIPVHTMCKALKITAEEYGTYRSGIAVVPNAVWKRAIKEYNFLAVVEGKERISY